MTASSSINRASASSSPKRIMHLSCRSLPTIQIWMQCVFQVLLNLNSYRNRHAIRSGLLNRHGGQDRSGTVLARTPPSRPADADRRYPREARAADKKRQVGQEASSFSVSSTSINAVGEGAVFGALVEIIASGKGSGPAAGSFPPKAPAFHRRL